MGYHTMCFRWNTHLYISQLNYAGCLPMRLGRFLLKAVSFEWFPNKMANEKPLWDSQVRCAQQLLLRSATGSIYLPNSKRIRIFLLRTLDSFVSNLLLGGLLSVLGYLRTTAMGEVTLLNKRRQQASGGNLVFNVP